MLPGLVALACAPAGAPSAAEPTLALDPGFEHTAVGEGPDGFRYAPPDSPWQFDGAGVTANGSRFTAANPPAPGGRHAAFIQAYGRITQWVFLPYAGQFGIDFRAAQRANGNERFQAIAVWLGGERVGESIAPPTTAYSDYTLTATVASGGWKLLEFRGLDPGGGDNTVLVDDVRVAPRRWGVWDPGLARGTVRSTYDSADEGTEANPLTLVTPCLWPAEDGAITSCNPGPDRYHQSNAWWQNGSFDAPLYWVFSVNTDPAQDLCNTGPPNLSLPRAEPGAGIAGFAIAGDPTLGDGQWAHLVLNQTAGPQPCAGAITYMAFGAQANRGNAHPVVAVNPVAAPRRIAFRAMLWDAVADPNYFRLTLLTAWTGQDGRTLPRALQVNLHAGGVDTPSPQRQYWAWPVQEDFYAHGGADIVYVNAVSLGPLCGMHVPVLARRYEEVSYDIDVDRLFRCLSPAFLDPVPEIPNLAVTGVHWAVENVHAFGSAIWVSVRAITAH